MPLLAGTQSARPARGADGIAGELEDNRRILRVQLRAAQDVSEIIARDQAGQSDGTYSAFSWRD